MTLLLRWFAQPTCGLLVALMLAAPAPGVAAQTATPAAYPVAPDPAECVATLRQVFACTNAGGFLRVYALFTDDFVRNFFAGTALTEEVIAFLSAPPQPLPEEQQASDGQTNEPHRCECAGLSRIAT